MRSCDGVQYSLILSHLRAASRVFQQLLPSEHVGQPEEGALKQRDCAVPSAEIESEDVDTTADGHHAQMGVPQLQVETEVYRLGSTRVDQYLVVCEIFLPLILDVSDEEDHPGDRTWLDECCESCHCHWIL